MITSTRHFFSFNRTRFLRRVSVSPALFGAVAGF